MISIRELLFYSADKCTNFKTLSFLESLENTQTLSLPEIKQLQWGKLRELLRFAYEKSKFYKNKFKQQGLVPKDIKCQEDLEKLPITTKEQIRAYKNEIISGKKSFFIESSGALGGYPTQTYVDFQAASEKYAVYLRHLIRYGWDFDTKIICFLPVLYQHKIVDYKNGIRQWLSTFIQNKIAHELLTQREIIFYNDLNPILNKGEVECIYKKISSCRKVILMGRINFFNILIHNFKIYKATRPKLKAIINVGEILPKSLSRRTASFFCCPVYDIYGSSEVSYVAGSCRYSEDLCINEETQYVEVLNESRRCSVFNQWGKVIITDLINYSMPFIRYEVGDIGIIKEREHNNSGFRLFDVGGRIKNCILVNPGKIVTEKKIADVVFNEEGVVQFHLKFISKGVSELQIIKSGTSIDQRRLIQNLAAAGLEKIRIKHVERLNATSKNKFQYISIV